MPRILTLTALVLAQTSICDFFSGCPLCEPQALSVNVGGDLEVVIGQPATLAGQVAGGVPPFTYQWSQLSGDPAAVANDASQSTSVTFAVPGQRSYRLTVTDAVEQTAFDDLIVEVLPPSDLTADAGQDRWLRPQPQAFNGGVSFGSGQRLTLNGLFGTDPLQATVSDENFASNEIDILWQVLSAPPPATIGQVALANPAKLSTNIVIHPVGGHKVPILLANGLLAEAVNTVVPGRYRFGCQVTNPLDDFAEDQVEYGILPAVALNAAGDPNGVALANGELTHQVLSAGGNGTLRYAVLASLNVTLSLHALDAEPTTNSYHLADVPVPANRPNAAFHELQPTLNLAAVPADTYRLALTWTDAEEPFELFEAIKADQWLHLQPPLPISIDVGTIGMINPNASGASLHGFVSEQLFAGTCATEADMNGDGIGELIIAGPQGVRLLWTTGPTDQASSPIDNRDPHDGDGPNEQPFWLDLPSGFSPWKVVICDLNRDGWPDLAVSDPTFDNGDGSVLLRYHNGTDQHGQNPYAGGAETLLLSVPGTGGALGYGLAGGDYNGDGFADLAIGQPAFAPPLLPGAGRVLIILADDALPGGQLLAQNLADAVFVGGARNAFAGVSVAFANLTDATGLELVVASPCEKYLGDVLLAGRLRFFPAGQLGALAPYKWISGDQPDNFLGRRLAVGDFDGDGRDEVFASGAFQTGGRVYVIPGDHPGGALGGVARVEGSPGQNLGASLGSGDFNGDGLADLLVHAPGLDSEPGGAKGVAEPSVVLVLGRGVPAGVLQPRAVFAVGLDSTLPECAGLLECDCIELGARVDTITTDYAALVDWNGDQLSDIMFGQASGGVGVAASR